MARFGKTNKMVANLIAKAKAKHGQQVTAKNYIAKVTTEYLNNERETLTLMHHGTIILYYNLTERKIISFDGWSASDRDALNTALDALGHYDGAFFKLHDQRKMLLLDKTAPVIATNVVMGGYGLQFYEIEIPDDYAVFSEVTTEIGEPQVKQIKQDANGDDYVTWGRNRVYLTGEKCELDFMHNRPRLATQRSPFEAMI